MHRLLGTALGLAALALPAPALAEVAGSQVTAPADGALFLDDATLPGAPQVAVAGTADAGAADTVDLVCEAGGGHVLLADDVAISDGEFAVSVGLDELSGRTCTLRALPGTGYAGTYVPFAGPRVAVSSYGESRVAGGPNAGSLYDFALDAQHLAGAFAIASAGGGALAASTTRSASLAPAPGAWEQAATFGARTLAGAGPHSALRVDGRPAYTPAVAQGLFGDGAGGDPDSADLVGLPELEVTRALDPATGRLTLTERAPLVRCTTDAAVPSAATCSAFVSTGVVLERTWEVDRGGLVAVGDAFRSTGAAHTVTPDLGVDSRGTTAAWALGAGGFDTFADGTVLAPPEAPFAALRYDRSLWPESAGAAPGALVFHQRPGELRFTSETGFDAVYAPIDVPAGGTSAPLRHTFVVAQDLARARAAGTQVADALAPPVVRVTTPAERATVPTDNVLVAGTVEDVAVASVSVNGTPALVAADRSFAAFVPLERGLNTLAVLATDTAGNTATEGRSVTYEEPARKRVAPAGVTRELTPARDRRAPFRFRVTGRVILPRDVSVGDGCNGLMLITVRSGKKTLAARTAQLLGSCAYKSGRFSWRTRRPFGPGRKQLTVSVRFTGNATLRGKAASRAKFRVR